MLAESGAATWTLVTFLTYIFGVFLLAAAAHRLARRRTFLKEYFLGSRGLGVWTLALTFAATAASGGSFTGFPSLIYTYGWILAVWIASYMVVPLCCLGLFGKRLNQVARKSDAVTIPDIFRDRHASARLGLLATALLVFFLIAFLIAQFKAGGIMIQTLMADIPVFQSAGRYLGGVAGRPEDVTPGYLIGLAIFALTVVFYTAYGGFRAVVWTDVMQGMIMVIGVALLLPLAMHKAYVYLSPIDPPGSAVAASVPAGRSAERERNANRYDDSPTGNAATPDAGRRAREQEPFRFSQLTEGLRKVNDHLKRDDPAALTGPGRKKTETDGVAGIKPFLPLGVAVSFFFIWPIAGAGQTHSMLRLMAFRDSKTLSRAMFTVCIYYGLIYLPLVVIFVIAKTLPLEIEQSDQAMPAMAIFAAPPVLAGLLIAAPFAAVMSTVDSLLLMISSALVRDIYQRAINPNVSERTIKRISIATTVGVGFVVMIAAVNPPEFLQDLIVFAAAGQAATFLGAMALTLYWPRATAEGTACAMGAGFCSVAGMYLIGWLQTGRFEPWTPLDLHPFIWGMVGSLVGGVVGSLLTPPPRHDLVATYFYRSASDKP